jgi:hypothetical protein
LVKCSSYLPEPTAVRIHTPLKDELDRQVNYVYELRALLDQVERRWGRDERKRRSVGWDDRRRYYVSRANREDCELSDLWVMLEYTTPDTIYNSLGSR